MTRALRTYFHRGRHRIVGPHSVTVADIQTPLADEYLPTGQRVGRFDVVRNAADGREYCRWSGPVVIGSAFITPPEAATLVPVLGVSS